MAVIDRCNFQLPVASCPSVSGFVRFPVASFRFPDLRFVQVLGFGICCSFTLQPMSAFQNKFLQHGPDAFGSGNWKLETGNLRHTSSANVSLNRSKTKYPNKKNAMEMPPSTSSHFKCPKSPRKNSVSWYDTARC